MHVCLPINVCVVCTVHVHKAHADIFYLCKDIISGVHQILLEGGWVNIDYEVRG